MEDENVTNQFLISSYSIVVRWVNSTTLLNSCCHQFTSFISKAKHENDGKFKSKIRSVSNYLVMNEISKIRRGQNKKQTQIKSGKKPAYSDSKKFI